MQMLGQRQRQREQHHHHLFHLLHLIVKEVLLATDAAYRWRLIGGT